MDLDEALRSLTPWQERILQLDKKGLTREQIACEVDTELDNVHAVFGTARFIIARRLMG